MWRKPSLPYFAASDSKRRSWVRSPVLGYLSSLDTRAR